MRARLPLRLTRSAAFAAVCVSLAALAHVAGGGSSPAPGVVVLALAGAFGLAVLLSGRERSTGTINGALLGAQLGLHELFGTSLGPADAVSGHAQGLSVGTGMLLAHLLATLVTGWWLARGEAALWSLLRRLGRRLTVLRPLPQVPPVRHAVPYFFLLAVPVAAAVEHSVSRRGPPLPA